VREDSEMRMFLRRDVSAARAIGWRSRAGRWCVAAVWVALFAAPLPASVGAEPQVTVREEGGVYTVAAAFAVPQPAATVVAVLTDYEEISRFMPDVRTSTVLERGPVVTVVAQEAVARLMMFSKRIYLELEVREEPGAITFRDRCGRSFARYEGAWAMTETDGQTSVTYRLVAKPSFEVPGFLLNRILKRDATEMIDRLRAEMAIRAQPEATSRP
jgi:carbon monoxide dehydrogenase subunit G